MKKMASESLVKRLEQAVAQIEALVPKLGARARGGRGGGGDEDEDEVPEYLEEYNAEVLPKFNAIVASLEPAGVSGKAQLEAAFGNLTKILQATVKCKKPSPQDLMAFMKDIVDGNGWFDKAAFKRPKRGQPDLKDHLTGLKELLASFQWVMMAPPNLPAPFVQAQNDSAMFSLNKVLKSCKGTDKQDQLRAFVNAIKDAGKTLYTYVKKNFKTGLDWNPKGGAIAEFSGSAAPAAAKPAPADDQKEAEEAAPPPKKTPAKRGGGGMADLFGELNKKGGGMGTHGSASSAFKLKKVTREMRTDKNPELRKSGMVSASAIKKKPSSKRKSAPKKQKPPSAVCRANRWLIENYRDNVTYQIPEDKIQVKHNVHIADCNSACIVVPAKVKSVMVESCQKCKIFVNEVISCIEMVNCKSTNIIVQKSAPSIAVDKSDSAKLTIMAAAMEKPPKIITSKISAMNIEIPDKNEPDDFVDVPVPEQFESTINPDGTITTVEVKHG